MPGDGEGHHKKHFLIKSAHLMTYFIYKYFHLLPILRSWCSAWIYKFCSHRLNMKLEINLNFGYKIITKENLQTKKLLLPEVFNTCSTNRTVTRDYISSTNFIDLGSTIKPDICWYIKRSHRWWSCFSVQWIQLLNGLEWFTCMQHSGVLITI